MSFSGFATKIIVYACSVARLYLTLYHPIDCSPPGSSVHGIFQARILEWVAISYSRGSSQPRDRAWVSCLAAWVSCLAGRFFATWPPGKLSILYIVVDVYVSPNFAIYPFSPSAFLSACRFMSVLDVVKATQEAIDCLLIVHVCVLSCV